MLEKLRFVIGVITIGLVLGLTFISAGLELKDYDLWLHIASGRYITQNFSVPATDFLSCTVKGMSWNNHEWLFQILVANLFDWKGPEGLVMMQVIVALSAMVILLLVGFNRNELLLTPFFLLLVQLVFAQRFTHRPDLFSLLFFAIYIFILAIHIDKRWSLPVLFMLQILWTNMHGFFFFGPLFVVLALIAEWIKRNVKLPYEWNSTGRLTDPEYERLGKIFFALIAACLFNPQFIKGAIYPLTVFFSLAGDHKIFFDSIQELARPIKWDNLFDTTEFPYFKLLIFISALSFFFNRRKMDISAFFLWLIFLLFSLKAIRNISFFAFAAFFVLQLNVRDIPWKRIFPIRFREKKFMYVTHIFMNLFLAVWIMNYSAIFGMMNYYDHDNYRFKSEFGGVSLRNYPNRAADFLVDNKIKGNFFNDFNSGAYLLGRCYPDIKVYIDGRTELYGPKFFMEYQNIWRGKDPELFETHVGKYGLTGALLSSVKHHIPAKFLKYLYGSKDWALVYFDDDGLIFLRDISENAEIISKYRIDLEKWEAQPPDLFKYGIEPISGYRQYYRAYTLESLDFDDKAMEEVKMALAIDPMHADAYQLLGKLLTKKGDYSNAFKAFRKAALIAPRREEIMYNVALAYTDLHLYEDAANMYQRIMDGWPSAKAAFLLSKAHIKNGNYDKAETFLSVARKMDPLDNVDVIGIADSFAEAEKYETAERVYKSVIGRTTKEHKTDILIKLGEIYAKTGRNSEAIKSFNEALVIDPENNEVNEKLSRLVIETEKL